MLGSFLPLPQIDLINFVFLQNAHLMLQSLIQKFIDIFNWMKDDHLRSFKTNTLTILQPLKEKAFVICIPRGVNPIPIVQSISKLPSVQRGSAPSIIQIPPKEPFIDSLFIDIILNPIPIFPRPNHLPLVYNLIFEYNFCIAINRILSNTFSPYQIVSNHFFAQFQVLFHNWTLFIAWTLLLV